MNASAANSTGAGAAGGGNDTAAVGSGAKVAACELYRISGDIIQMKRLGCPDIPVPKIKIELKTIPIHVGSHAGVDEQIARCLRYFLLGILMFIAIAALLSCCCRFYTRILKRKEAFRDREFRGRSTFRSTRNATFESGYNRQQNGFGAGSVGTRRLGMTFMGSTYAARGGYGFECHDCCRESVNML